VVAGLVALVVFASLGPQNTLAQVCNPGGLFASMGIVTPTGASIFHDGAPILVAHIGDTITIYDLVVGTGSFGGSCGVTNGQGWVVFPDNTVQKAMQNFTLLSSAAGGSGQQCPFADTVCLSFTQTYVVNAADMNKMLLFTTNNGTSANTCQAAPQINEVQFAFNAIGTPVGSPGGGDTACPIVPVLVLFPSISITKQCVTNSSPSGSPIDFQGTIKNISPETNTALDHIAVSDSPSATITFSAMTAFGNAFDPVVGNLNNHLAPGDSVDYTGNYILVDLADAPCGPFTDTITVTAQDITGFEVTDTAIATCRSCGPPCNPGFGGVNIGVMTPTGATVIHNGVPTLVAHFGDTITIQALEVFNSGSGTTCGVTNGQGWVVYPNNSIQQVMQDFTLVSSARGGSGHQCPSGDPVCLPFTETYVVNAADLNRPLSFSTNNGIDAITFEASPEFFEVQFGFVVLGASVGTAGGFSGSDYVTVLVISPSISITKECVTNCPPQGSANYGSPIDFRGTITSGGDTILGHISLSDSPSATITFSTNTAFGNPFDPVVGNLNNYLVPGDSIDYTGSYSPAGFGAALCGPFSDTITVTAQDITGAQVSDTASATCSVCSSPCLQVTRDCGPKNTAASSPSSPVTIGFSGIVTNCGSVPLTNVVVTGSADGGPPTMVTNIARLEPYSSTPYTGTFTESGHTAHFDVVHATGANLCGGIVVQSDDSYCTNVVVPAPRFTGIGFNPDFTFSLQFTGATDAAYRILSSTNLHDWQALGFATQTVAGAYQFTDLGATNQSRAFYRVALP
jgi:hypothetical protein